MKQTLPNRADQGRPPSAAFCPRRKKMVQLEICGRQQEQSQAPCKRAECPWLDSTRASDAWESYKERHQ